MTDRPLPVRPVDDILSYLLNMYPLVAYKYHEHESLLEQKNNEELSEKDKALAWISYEHDMIKSGALQLHEQTQPRPRKRAASEIYENSQQFTKEEQSHAQAKPPNIRRQKSFVEALLGADKNMYHN